MLHIFLMIRAEDEHYLLDSNIVFELFRFCADFNVLKKMIEHSSDMPFYVITLNELLYRTKNLPDGSKRKTLIDFIQNDIRKNFKIKLFVKKSDEIHSEIQSILVKIEKSRLITQVLLHP